MKATSLTFHHRSFFLLVTTAFLLLCPPLPQVQAQLESQTVYQFVYAIYQNDTNAALKMLESNTNLAYCKYGGDMGGNILPLLEAAAAGNFGLVKRLLDLGVDVNAEGRIWLGGSRMTALDEAVQHRHLEITELLFEAGANPNHWSFQDSTLHLAFASSFNNSGSKGNAIAAALLEYGANPFAEAGYYKNTPFEFAITRSDGRLVPLMLDANRKVKTAPKAPKPSSTRNKTVAIKEQAAQFLKAHGSAMLSAAAQRGELEALEALFRAGVILTNSTPDSLTPMQAFAVAAAAAERAWPGTKAEWQQAQEELSRGYSPQADSRFVAERRARAEALARAVQTSAPEWQRKILDLLIQHGADYDALAATALNDTNQISRLLATRSNVAESRDFAGNTPLHWAVNTDRPQLLAFWIDAGTSLAATNAAGQTALHLAAVNGKTEFVKALLAAHAPTDIHDTNGWTPLDAAIQAKQSDSIRLLLADKSAPAHSERGITGSLHEAAAAGNIAALTSLTETETNLEARNELGLTPLQVAGQAGQLGAAAFLIDHGADVNARDPDGNTVLHQILLSRSHWIKGRPSDAWVERRKKNPSEEKFWRAYSTPSGYTSPRELAASVAFFLACGADPAATNHAGQTILQLVTSDAMVWEYDRNAILPLLQQSGNGLNERDADGNTALHRLCTGFYDVTKLENMASLIASGADINATNNLGQTSLHLAAQKIGGWDHNDPPVNEPFQLLIYKNADVNARDNQGRTPLDVVVASDSSFKAEATALLIKAGAKAGDKDKQGLTPVHQALTGEWPWRSAGENLQQLAKAGADFSAKDKDGKTPLHYLAALANQSPLFFIRGVDQIFINAKVDFNARDNDGNTPLHIAAKRGTHDVFDWLIKQGAGLDETNNAGETPRLLVAHASTDFPRFGPPNAETDIFTAVRQGNLEALSALIKADPGLVNAKQYTLTPLRAAVVSRRTNVVEFLEQHGARWDIISAVMAGRSQIASDILAREPEAIATNQMGSPLLHLAAANGDLVMAKILLAAKADIRAQDRRGVSPLGVARLRNHPDVAQILRERGATENIFDVALLGGDVEAKLLLQRNKSLALATNAMGFSASDIASGAGQAEVLKRLLDNGANPERATSSSGLTPLHLAAIYDQTNTARLLIRRGAKVNTADRSGFTPLHLASARGATDVAGILLKAKADPNQPMSEPAEEDMRRMPNLGGPRGLGLAHESALHLAAIMNQTNMIKLLLASGASVNAADGRGRTPLDLAQFAGFPPRDPWMQRSLGRMDPLGLTEPPMAFFIRTNIQDQKKAAAALLESAGGKRGQSGQRPGQPSGFWP